jgi:hypothetical protein
MMGLLRDLVVTVCTGSIFSCGINELMALFSCLFEYSIRRQFVIDGQAHRWFLTRIIEIKTSRRQQTACLANEMKVC